MTKPVQNARHDFPTIMENQSDLPLTYLDSAASSLKPNQVINAVADFYKHDYANIHRGLYDLSAKASEAFEQVRKTAATFIHAASEREIVFVRNGTEGFNLLASCLAKSHIKPSTQIIVTYMEHHANLVPWQVAAKQCNAQLVSIPLLASGDLDLKTYKQLLTKPTSLVCFTAVSNVLGTVNPVKEIVELAHQAGALTVVDAAQLAPHMPMDVQAFKCDFLSISGHKCYGPTGASFIYGKLSLLEQLPPYQTGGGMIEVVEIEQSTYAPVPQRFEAGTPAIAEVVGLGVALNYMMSFGMQAIYDYEHALLIKMEGALKALPYISIIGEPTHRTGLISFNIADIHPHDVASLLNEENVAVRAGHHCAMPLHMKLNVAASVRASLGIYNNEQDIERLIVAIEKIAKLFGVIDG
jgi:cysteine desulfurase/selenocysteine lyase